MTRDESTYQPVRYADHLARLRWQQGEHVFISGATGSGKTTLARDILAKRKHVMAFCVKYRDDTILREYPDYHVVSSIRDVKNWQDRIMVWPRLKRGSAEAWLANQQREIDYALSQMIKSRGWTLFVDELNYLSKHARIRSKIETLHYIGRSSHITMVTTAQRPAYVPLAVLTNASHAYLGRTRFNSDLKRLADFGDIDPRLTSRTLISLPTKHDFLYLPTQGEGTAAIVNSAV